MKLLIATHNQHKLHEIRTILALPQLEIIGMDIFPDLPEVIEDGDTFEANAIKKATEVAAATGLLTMADDSGLEVDALDGAPGVYSARYAGEPSNDSANNRKLLAELKDITDRTARFRCAIALVDPGKTTQTVDGRCEGKIGFEPCGKYGFGYDPLFVPAGFTKTFAELSDSEKNSISHRGAALASARKSWFTTL
jgi:XTP/dITP diphosphohydrolase